MNVWNIRYFSWPFFYLVCISLSYVCHSLGLQNTWSSLISLWYKTHSTPVRLTDSRKFLWISILLPQYYSSITFTCISCNHTCLSHLSSYNIHRRQYQTKLQKHQDFKVFAEFLLDSLSDWQLLKEWLSQYFVFFLFPPAHDLTFSFNCLILELHDRSE